MSSIPPSRRGEQGRLCLSSRSFVRHRAAAKYARESLGPCSSAPDPPLAFLPLQLTHDRRDCLPGPPYTAGPSCQEPCRPGPRHPLSHIPGGRSGAATAPIPAKASCPGAPAPVCQETLEPTPSRCCGEPVALLRRPWYPAAALTGVAGEASRTMLGYGPVQEPAARSVLLRRKRPTHGFMRRTEGSRVMRYAPDMFARLGRASNVRGTGSVVCLLVVRSRSPRAAATTSC